MRRMNKLFFKLAIAILLVLLGPRGTASGEEEITFRASLTASERRCLEQMLSTGHWRRSPQFHQEMIAAAVAARADLRGNGQRQYIFVMTDFGSCGTAGCAMLIGEKRDDGVCHEMYSGSGVEIAMAVLRQRDHGYRRLYTPCEIRFHGHEYQQIHEECPTLDVQR